MRLRDPKADDDRDGVPDSHVYVNGEAVPVESDGTFESAAIDEQWAEGYAERNGYALSDVLVDEAADEPSDAADEDVCTEVKADGEVCGRDRPCPYHD